MNCPICENEFIPIISNNSTIYKCPKCNLRHLEPMHRNFDTHFMYNNHKYSSDKARWAKRSVKKYLTDIKKLKRNPITVLDLGAGLGYYSRAFADEGLNVTYVDLDKYSLAFSKSLNKNNKIDIVESDIKSFLENSKSKFDIIFFRHVIEHMEDPIGIVKLLSNLMVPESILIIETDNNRSKELVLHPEAKIYWRESYKLEFGIKNLKELFKYQPFAVSTRETHWWGFNIDNLDRLIKKACLKVVKKKEYHLGDQYFWPNITNFRQLLANKKITWEYLWYRIMNRPGAGLLFYVSK